MRFAEERITAILNEAGKAGNIREVNKPNNITEPMFCCWRMKFGGMNFSDAMELKKIE